MVTFGHKCYNNPVLDRVFKQSEWRVTWSSLQPLLKVFLFFLAWADNGDAISRQYAGTGALKSDFTRTGKRSQKGVMKDGFNSLSRYYINNFKDGLRQVIIPLFSWQRVYHLNYTNQVSIDLFLGVQHVESIDINVFIDEETVTDPKCGVIDSIIHQVIIGRISRFLFDS